MVVCAVVLSLIIVSSHAQFTNVACCNFSLDIYVCEQIVMKTLLQNLTNIA